MGDGYVGSAQDAVRIRRLEKQREAEHRKIEELKNKTSSTQGQAGLLQFGSGTSEESPKLAGTVNFGTATVMGIFAGMLYGGSKEAAASASKDAEVTLKLGSTPDKREQYRLMRDAMEKRFYRVTRGSLVGGVRLGIFTAAFYGLQDLFVEKRGVHDVYNIAAAGSATAATFGLIMPGSLLWRARNVMMGSVLGAAFCFPLGWAQLKLIEKANEEKLIPHPQLNEKGEVKTGLEVAIERLEGSIKK